MPEQVKPVAISDVGTKLFVGSSLVGSYNKLVGIKTAPASGSAGGTIEVTELESPRKQYIDDRIDTPEEDFLYNRTEANYAKVHAICDGAVHYFTVLYSDGTATIIEGTAKTWKNELSSGQAQEATLHIVATNIYDVPEDGYTVSEGAEGTVTIAKAV